MILKFSIHLSLNHTYYINLYFVSYFKICKLIQKIKIGKMTTRAIKKLTKKDELLELNKRLEEKIENMDEDENESEKLANVGKNKFNLVKSIFQYVKFERYVYFIILFKVR
jgi:hypothetical protein